MRLFLEYSQVIHLGIGLLLIYSSNLCIGFVQAYSTSNDGSGCGYAEIGNVQCGIVNQVTSIDITLWPPAETSYEITEIWEDRRDSGRLDEFITYYTNITSATTVTLKVMFSEPDVQNLTITVRGYSDSYLDDDYYSSNAGMACYETIKPPNAKSDIWTVTIGYDECYESLVVKEGGSSYGTSNSLFSSQKILSFLVSTIKVSFVLAAVIAIGYIIRTQTNARNIQAASVRNSLLQKSAVLADVGGGDEGVRSIKRPRSPLKNGGISTIQGLPVMS